MSEHIIETETLAGVAFVPIGGTSNLREEIVRCRDCKHFRSSGDDYLFCNLAARELDGGDGFCAWGERRDA